MVPAAPKSLSASDITENSINLSWDDVTAADSANPVQAYIIEVQKGSGSFEKLAEVSGGVTSFVAEQLAADTPYQFAVKAKNLAGESENAAMLPQVVQTAAAVEKVAVGG